MCAGPDARANAAGGESWNRRLEKIAKLRELAEKYKLSMVTEYLRDNLPAHRHYTTFRKLYWDDGSTLRVADRCAAAWNGTRCCARCQPGRLRSIWLRNKMRAPSCPFLVFEAFVCVMSSNRHD